jgi:hypothetical protein
MKKEALVVLPEKEDFSLLYATIEHMVVLAIGEL